MISLWSQEMTSLDSWLKSLPNQVRKHGASKVAAKAESTVSHKQQKLWIDEIITICTRFPAHHFLRKLALDLAEYDALARENQKEASIRKAEKASDCRTALRQLECLLEAPEGEKTGPSYSIAKKSVICQVCNIQINLLSFCRSDLIIT